MISGVHSVIRTAESDDAENLYRIYDPTKPRAVFLDRRREFPYPTVDELRESLVPKEGLPFDLYAVEDKAGSVRGYCGLRIAGADLGLGEVILLLHEDGDCETPMAQEVIETLCRIAFKEKRLHKVMAHCLDTETALRPLLFEAGFTCEGRQRDVVYFGGRYHDLEAFTLFQATFESRTQ